MWALPLIGYVGVVFGFGFLTLSIGCGVARHNMALHSQYHLVLLPCLFSFPLEASGLYYLSELVEEHTVLAKKLLTRAIYVVIAIQATLAVIDRFPWSLCLLSMVSHVTYAQNLRRFPVVKLTDPVFIISCVLVLLNHYLWFRHFSSPDSIRPSSTYSYAGMYADPQDIPTFTEIASFFGLCVWLIPFALFVSLSAGENVLPSMGSEYATGDGSTFISPGREPSTAAGYGADVGITSGASNSVPKKRGRSNTANAGMAKAVVTGVRDWMDETGAVMGFWNGENVRPL